MPDSIKLALADDHNLFRKGVEEILEEYAHFQVLFSVSNGKELIRKLEQATELPDVCLVDINMPEHNGFETTKMIKERWPDIRVIALSMYDSEHNIMGMLRAGARGYLLKDSQPAVLKKAIEDVYAMGFFHSDLVTGKMLSQLMTEPQKMLHANEVQFLKHCCTEMTYKEIADVMGVSHRTIDGYRDQLFAKLDIKSRTGLVIYALKTGIVQLDERR